MRRTSASSTANCHSPASQAISNEASGSPLFSSSCAASAHWWLRAAGTQQKKTNTDSLQQGSNRQAATRALTRNQYFAWEAPQALVVVVLFVFVCMHACTNICNLRSVPLPTHVVEATNLLNALLEPRSPPRLLMNKARKPNRCAEQQQTRCMQ